MSWTSNGFFRNVNVLAEITPENQESPIDLYQPGTLNTGSLREGARYSGFITSLRLRIDIKSLPEIDLPVREIGATNQEYSERLRGVDLVSPKKRLHFFVRSSDRPAMKIASLSLFNRRPYYPLDVLTFLTDASTFDMASDAVLSAQTEDIGWGLLEDFDSLIFLGSAVEEAENTAPTMIVNVFGGGGSSGSVITTSSGDVVTTNAGEPVTYG